MALPTPETNTKRLKDPNKPPSNGVCHPLRLPVELRLDIYDLVLAAHTLDPSQACKAHTPPIMLTCRLIRQEMLAPYIDRLCELYGDCQEALKTAKSDLKEQYEEILRAFWAREIPWPEVERRRSVQEAQYDERVKRYRVLKRMILAEGDRIIEEEERGSVLEELS